MVSMRVSRSKFTEGEKVLCYEPDPAKTKVLYDSKVLDIVSRKDESGKKILEFLIHFQGWNSTWDRFVTEDFILKDTEDNRRLQRELAEKAQLTSGCGNLYRRDCKKKSSGASTGLVSCRSGKDLSNRSNTAGNEAGSGNRGSGVTTEGTSGATVATTSSRRNAGNDERSEDGCPRLIINFAISQKMRVFLEADVTRIKQQNKVVRLPCRPTALEILQMWMTEYIYGRIRLMCNKKSPKSNVPNKAMNSVINQVLAHANLCHEVADGLRVYLDFMLKTALLYNEERPQFANLVPPDEIKLEEDIVNSEEPVQCKEKIIKLHKEKITKENHFKDKCKDKYSKDSVKEKNVKDLGFKDRTEFKKENITHIDEGDHDRRKSLRPRGNTGEVAPVSALVVVPSAPSPSLQIRQNMSNNETNVNKRAVLRGKTRSAVGSGLHGPMDITELLGPESNKGNEQLFLPVISKREKELLKKVANRKLLPKTFNEVLKPSSYCGAIHLSRSLLKMPELLASAEYSDMKVNLLLDFLKHFMTFLEEHPEWFAESCYASNANHGQSHESQTKKQRLNMDAKVSSNHKIPDDLTNPTSQYLQNIKTE